jgi:hypothetical protein
MKRIAMIVAVVLLMAGCAKAVPPGKLTYVGEWQTRTMYLLITADGSVRYKRLQGGVTTSIEGPLREFHGDDFVVGFWPMLATFKVTETPHQEGAAWVMMVDGVKLTRTAGPEGHAI